LDESGPRKPGNVADSGDSGREVVGPKACPEGVPGQVICGSCGGLEMVWKPTKDFM